ncbi:unnamed protein product, partial [Meganyctiphanes norvegica]
SILNKDNSTDLGNESMLLDPPLDVIPALRIRYQIILPIFITAGIIANTFTFLVATRPKLRGLHVNVYIKVLSLLDLLGFIMRFPMVFDVEYCGYSDYSMAFYMTHLGWFIVNCLRAISSYVLVFLSLDRFRGIWFPITFRNTKGNRKKRLIISAIWVFLTAYIPWSCFLLKVSGNGHQWYMSYSISSWFRFFQFYSALVTSGFPSICIVGLNIGIAVGFKKRVYRMWNIGNMNQPMNKISYHTIAVLALNSSFAVCCFPYMVTS